MDSQTSALLRALVKRQKAIEAQLNLVTRKYEEFVRACEDQPRSITQEIDSIPGRRIFFTLEGLIDFDIANDGLRGEPLTYLVSQDGPFIMTHFPLAIWKPSEPAGATNFGQWSPVTSWPLPAQQNAAQDRIDLSYNFADAGSQRNFQNADVPPLFSWPGNLVPLPVPTLFAPNSTIVITPTFENIFFDPAAAVPSTAGELHMALPGFRVANL